MMVPESVSRMALVMVSEKVHWMDTVWDSSSVWVRAWGSVSNWGAVTVLALVGRWDRWWVEEMAKALVVLSAPQLAWEMGSG